ncbi:MAG: hypothetical protein AAF611_03225 [Bacteroidota bacterium]
MKCTGSKTGAKVSYVSKQGKILKLQVDWSEGSTFDAGNLVVTNGTITNSSRVNRNNPTAVYTINITDESKDVKIEWSSGGTRNYCGGTSMIISSKSMKCLGSKRGAEVRLLSKNGKTIKLEIDWNEGSTFDGRNLVVTNGTVTDSKRVNQNDPLAVFTIQQTDASKDVKIEWTTRGTRTFCGGTFMVIPK